MAEPTSETLQQAAQRSGSVPASQLGPILRAILQHNNQLVEQNQNILQLLNYHVQSLPGSALASPTSPPLHLPLEQRSQPQFPPTSPIPLPSPLVTQTQKPQGHFRDESRMLPMWDGILVSSSKRSPGFVKEYHLWQRLPALLDAFLGKNEWTSKTYQWAYPHLVDFLASNAASKKCHSQVSIKDFTSAMGQPVPTEYNEARPRVGLLRGTKMPVRGIEGQPRIVKNAHDPFGCNLLWEALDGCPCRGRGPAVLTPDSEGCLCMRSISVIDISPKVLTCILASTPRTDLSYLAAFMQRHLESSNWGKATPLRYGQEMSSYTLEYHFSFYYVTPKYFESNSVKPDLRKLRTSASFGNELSTRSRFIHEESLSFLYVGHFRDVATCIQLAENYFKHDPYHTTQSEASDSSLFRPFNPKERPAMLLLSWIAVALHHVLWRWQSAIDAVQVDLKSNRQIMFTDNRNELMSDDPQFTLSKTYFWALQAYKLFEETISATVATWRRFEEDSLPVIRDKRIPADDWAKALQGVEDAIGELEKKIVVIQKHAADVRDLREGLLSASTLFYSRTSVNQGENIRLLTYITLLFLPLSFATSIFGMQIMGSGPNNVHAFAATLPAITVLTALFVFNLDNSVRAWDYLSGTMSSWLRDHMGLHRRGTWHRTATALHQDIKAFKTPIQKAEKGTTEWVYVIFVLEAALVSGPVGELANAMRLFRRVFGINSRMVIKQSEHKEDDVISVDFHVVDKIKESLAEERDQQRRARRKKIGPVFLAIDDTWNALPGTLLGILIGLLDIMRALLLPLWTFVVASEYILVTTWLLLKSLLPQRADNDLLQPVSKTPEQKKGHSVFRHAFLVLGLDSVFPPRRPHHQPIQKATQKTLSRAATQLTALSDKPNTQPMPTPVASPYLLEKESQQFLRPPSPALPLPTSPPDYSKGQPAPPLPLHVPPAAVRGTRAVNNPQPLPADIVQATPKAPSFGSDATASRPGTAHTYESDAIGALPMVARAQSVRRVNSQGEMDWQQESGALGEGGGGLRISAIEQKPKTVPAEQYDSERRRSEVPVLELLEASGPPTPPPPPPPIPPQK